MRLKNDLLLVSLTMLSFANSATANHYTLSNTIQVGETLEKKIAQRPLVATVILVGLCVKMTLCCKQLLLTIYLEATEFPS